MGAPQRRDFDRGSAIKTLNPEARRKIKTLGKKSQADYAEAES
jgi:hypothetical protein